jgi:hypothetical protein
MMDRYTHTLDNTGNHLLAWQETHNIALIVGRVMSTPRLHNDHLPKRNTSNNMAQKNNNKTLKKKSFLIFFLEGGTCVQSVIDFGY